MNAINNRARPLLYLLLLLGTVAVTTSCVSRNALVSGVETLYVPDTKAVLSVSGETASVPGHFPFTIDDPMKTGKLYTNESGETLVFETDENGHPIAVLTDSKGRTTQFVFLGYGGTQKATVIGFWRVHAE